MDKVRFEELVARAVDVLPDEFLERMENIDVVIESAPTRTHLRHGGTKHGVILLGLYEGIPTTRRGSAYGMVIPDKITIFQNSIESICNNDEEIIQEIGRVVRHEIAHHFGISDARLKQLENKDR